MGSRDMALHKILVLVSWLLGGCFCQEASTPVPILKFLDTQNENGSYTYGFEAGDGTYKIETRYPDGQVQGKFGYYDPDGVLRESLYGVAPGEGFQAEIDGVTTAHALPKPLQPEQGRPVNQNFAMESAARDGENIEGMRNINGRRAVLRKRLRARPQSTPFIQQQVSAKQVRQNNNPRQRQHFPIRTPQREHQTITNNRINNFNNQETFRSRPSLPSNGVSDPFLTNLNLNTGSYAISY